jgi:Uma2 family endonuclease
LGQIGYNPLCPDFAIELGLPSDRLPQLQARMQEYVANGLQLGWLIDPEARQVFGYDHTGRITQLENPTAISGEPLLPGFTLDLQPIWPSDF